MPFISIIIPTFNSSNILAVALHSILQQTFTDFEILIIDGHSIDKTLDIAKSFNDNRIQIYSEKDKGIYDAMNKGIKLAQGKWIYFLGSDDRLFTSNILQRIFNTVTKNNCDVIYGDVLSTRFNGRYDGEFNYLKIKSQNICHQSIFFKKIIFKKIGLFNLRYKSHADWDHNMHWFLSPKITKLYYDDIIAEYADGGFSSLNGDIVFANERILKYLLYAKKRIDISLRIQLLIKELKRAAILHNKWYFLKIVINIPKIIAGV